MPNATIQWHISSGDMYLQEDLSKEHMQGRPTVFCASWWDPQDNPRRKALPAPETTLCTRPQVPFLTCVVPRETLRRSYFRETNPTKNSHANSALQWVDYFMYQIHSNRSISYKRRDSCYFCNKLI